MKNQSIPAILSLRLTVFASLLTAQIPVLPGAEGFGSTTSAGRSRMIATSAQPESWNYEATVFDSNNDPDDANLSRPEFCILGHRAYVTFRRTVSSNKPGAVTTEIVLKVFDVSSDGDWTDRTTDLFPDNPHVLYGPDDPHNVGDFTDHQLLCSGNAFFLIFEANFQKNGQKMVHTVVRRYNPDWSFNNQVALLETAKGPGVQLYKSDDGGAAWLNGTLFIWVVKLRGGLGTPATGFALYGLNPTTLEVTVDDSTGGPRILENPLNAPFAGVMDFIDGEYRLLTSPQAAGGRNYDQDGLVEYRYDMNWKLLSHTVADHPFGEDQPTYTTSRLRYGDGMQVWGFTVVPVGRDQSGGAIGRAWVRLADANGNATYFPVSDLDSTRHTEIIVHNGKAYVGYFHVTEPRTTTIRRYAIPDEQIIPPLYVFYVNHTHLAGDHLPYTDRSMTTLDPNVAENFNTAIEDVAMAMDRYGARASWEVVYGAARGLCEYGGEDHIFRRLLATGHEIGLHVHSHHDYDQDYQALHDACGVDPTVTSGLIVGTKELESGEAHDSVAAAIRTNLGFGVKVGTINMSRNAFMERCNGQVGVGNDMWEQTGNLMFPWRPNYRQPNICADDPDGDFVLIDHVDMASWIQLPAMADLLTQADFNRLRALFDAALAYMKAKRPRRVAAWGFVTHIHEFMRGSQGENPADDQTVELFGEFWSYVAQQAAAGRVIFATAGEIAEAAMRAFADTVATGVNPHSTKVPAAIRLFQNYPNPFNPTTTIRFSLPKAEHVTLKVFDVNGREVATLVEEERAVGEHSVVFDAKGLPSGVYFYRLTTGPFTQIRKALLMK